MKVYYGAEFKEMMKELRGQAITMARLHVLTRREGNRALLNAHVTAYCNDQVFEAVVSRPVSLPESPEGGTADVLRAKAEEFRLELLPALEGLEVRRGIFQP